MLSKGREGKGREGKGREGKGRDKGQTNKNFDLYIQATCCSSKPNVFVCMKVMDLVFRLVLNRT